MKISEYLQHPFIFPFVSSTIFIATLIVTLLLIRLFDIYAKLLNYKPFRKSFYALILLILYGTIYTYFKYDYPLLDSFYRTLHYPLEETIYLAPNFNDKNFRQIKIGMDRKEVIRLVGIPAYIKDSGVKIKNYWAYAGSSAWEDRYPEISYHKRAITFDKQDRVSHIYYQIYFD